MASDLAGYLDNLEMVAEVRWLDRFTIPRAQQLLQRSNQFNLTTIRFTEAELQRVAADPSHYGFTIRLRDRLGDNGIIAVLVTRADGPSLVVENWVMSCRVLERRVEEMTLGVLASHARGRGCNELIGEYRPTSKNAMVADLYPRLGFATLKGQVGRFRLSLSEVPSGSDLPITVKIIEE